MNTMPADPTAFRPMKITASKATEIGFELEPIAKKLTLDKMRIFWGWPRVPIILPEVKTFHTDYEAAQKFGFRKPLIGGPQMGEVLAEMCIKFFGKGYLGGKLSMSFIKVVEIDQDITVKGVVKDKVAEGDAVRLILDIWCENEQGEKVVVGTASGLVH